MQIPNLKIFLTRRRFMKLIGGLLSVPLIPGCVIKNQPLTIGLHIWPGYEPTPLAKLMGWLDEHLIKLVQIKSSSDSIKLLELGKIDGAGLTLDEVLRVRERGIQLSVILFCDISAGADQFLVRPEITSLADIKGHRIGVEEGALGALMLSQVIQAAGLRIEDIEPVSLTIDQHVDAWKRGEIDAVVTYEPAAFAIVEMGGKRLFDSSMIPELIVDTLAIRSELLDRSHSQALHHLVAMHLKGLLHLNSNSDDASYRIAPRFNMPPSRIMAMFKGLVTRPIQ